MRIQLDSSPMAPGEARAFIEEHWHPLFSDVQQTQADVVLVASELVTNAVEAGAHHIVLEIRAEDTHVEFSVSDDAAGWPTPQRPEPHEAAGRGLFITSQLATHWRADRHPLGKTLTTTWARRLH